MKADVLEQTSDTTHLEPVQQPGTIREITDRLFPSYRTDGGTVHLAGCRIESRAFLRFGFWDGSLRIEIYLDEQGNEVEPELISALGLCQAVETEPPLRRRCDIAPLCETGWRLIKRRLGDSVSAESFDVGIVWCKYVYGKLQFTFGEDDSEIETEISFSDWASRLVPPLYECPYTGRSTYHLAVTDDCRIVAGEEIVRCDVSKRLVLAEETVQCAASGRRILKEFSTTCPVTGDTVWCDALIQCRMCGQRVSPTAVTRGKCSACRNLAHVPRDHEVVRMLLARSPELKSWRNWHLAETSEVIIAMASGWIRKILIVLNRRTLEPLRIVSTGRLLEDWTDMKLNLSVPSGIPALHFDPSTKGDSAVKSSSATGDTSRK